MGLQAFIIVTDFQWNGELVAARGGPKCFRQTTKTLGASWEIYEFVFGVKHARGQARPVTPGGNRVRPSPPSGPAAGWLRVAAGTDWPAAIPQSQA
jgi:hypothetical protein